MSKYYPDYIFEKKVEDKTWQSILDKFKQQELIFFSEKGVFEKVEDIIKQLEVFINHVIEILQEIAVGLKDKTTIKKYDTEGYPYKENVKYGHIHPYYRTRSEQMMAALFMRDSKIMPFLNGFEQLLERLMVVSRKEVEKDQNLATEIDILIREEKATARKSWSSKPLAISEMELIGLERKERTAIVKLEEEELTFLHHVRLFYSVIKDIKARLEQDLIKIRNEYRQDNWQNMAPPLAKKHIEDLKRLMEEMKKYGERLKKDFEGKADSEKFLEQLMRKINIMRKKTSEIPSLVSKKKKFTYY